MNAILAAVDFSDVSEAVMNEASRLAAALSCRVYIVHVTSPEPDYVGYEVGPETVRTNMATQYKQEHKKLQELVHTHDWPDLEQAVPLLIEGVTHEKILKEQQSLDAGLIIMGSHGHGALHKLLVGSVAEAVLKHATVPVMIVPCPGKEL